MNLFIAQDFKNRKRWQRQQAKLLRPTLTVVYEVMKPLVEYSVIDLIRKTGLNRAKVYPRLTELNRIGMIRKYSDEQDVDYSNVFFKRLI